MLPRAARWVALAKAADRLRGPRQDPLETVAAGRAAQRKCTPFNITYYRHWPWFSGCFATVLLAVLGSLPGDRQRQKRRLLPEPPPYSPQPVCDAINLCLCRPAPPLQDR